MVLVQNWPFFHLLFLANTGQENVFYDILERKNAFLSYKNKKFKKSKNWDFSKGVNLWFWSKIGLFPSFVFRHYRPGKCVLRESFHFFLLKIRPEMKFNNVLDRKETFLVIYKNELHTVSGHFSVNWSYLIIETKTEKLGKCLFFRISFVETTFCRGAVREGGFLLSTEYISWS